MKLLYLDIDKGTLINSFILRPRLNLSMKKKKKISQTKIGKI